MSEADTTDHPVPPRRRRRWVWRSCLGAYVVLVVISGLVRDGGYRQTELSPAYHDYLAIESPRFTAMGEREGEPVRFASRIWGTRTARPPAILVHGSPGGAGQFGAGGFADLVAGNRLVIAPDLPGFGISDRWVPSYAPRAHARYVIHLMDTLGIESAHLLGFSMGSAVALEMLDLAPDRVASLCFYGGVGIMEGEGSGDWHFEQLKYLLGYAGIVGVPELIPHFGLLDRGLFGGRAERHAFIRNFLDSDFRPYRDQLANLDASVPLQILHGRRDFLVRDWVAEEHHALVEHSELVMFPQGHFMLFSPPPASALAEAYTDFIARVDRPGFVPTRRTDDLSEGPREPPPGLPVGDFRRGLGAWAQIAIIAAGTLLTEDGTAAATGVLIAAGQVDVFVGLFAVWFGIFVGDMGLYFVGRRIGRPALRWKAVRRWMPTRSIDKLGAWLTKRTAAAIFMSRCLPGTRLPLYVVAGVTKAGAWRFALWTAIAGAIWTPLIVGVAAISWTIVGPLARWLELGPLAFILGLIIVIVVVNVTVQVVTHRGRQRLMAQWCRLTQHEFWPTWLVYLPIVPALAWLAIKHRSLTVWTLANPCMPDGGLVGESKHDIVQMLPEAWRLDTRLIPHGNEPGERADAGMRAIDEAGWSLPVIVKPDASQRGTAVHRIRDRAELEDYLTEVPVDVHLQVYHPGPLEAGVFYVRRPSEERGSLFSATVKVFRELEGDGARTIAELIWADRRSRVQEKVFHERFADRLQDVPASGERFRITESGNHAQGCMFKDGAHLLTPALEERLDEIARSVDGFYFGRFDLRYESDEALAHGEGFRLIELNGVTSESTNIYDPAWPVWRAWGVLIRQWSLAFAIGAEVRATTGQRPRGAIALARDVVRYYRANTVDVVAD
ncbi:MAG: alpha/beta fold hydrolase [Planctomycetota bacterium]